MAVFRRPQANNFFASSRAWMQDYRLSCQATGLLARMLSMPPDWEFHQSQLAKVMKEKEHAIRSAMMELVKYGYLLKMPRKRDEKGQLGDVVYEAWDTAQLLDPLDDKDVDVIFSNGYSFRESKRIYPKPGFPDQGQPDQASPGLQDRHPTIPSGEHKNNNTDSVVVHPCLQELVLPFEYRRLLSQEIDALKAQLLVTRVKRWKDRENDLVGCRVVLKRWAEWSDKLTEEEKLQQEHIQESIDQSSEDARRQQAIDLKARYPHMPFEVKKDRIEIKSDKGIHSIGFRFEEIDKYLKYIEERYENKAM